MHAKLKQLSNRFSAKNTAYSSTIGVLLHVKIMRSTPIKMSLLC